MALIKPMVSSKSNEWSTPQKFFDFLNNEFHFTLDPCATHENAKCEKYYTIEDDGLSKDWGKERVFVNPPYGGHTRKWLEKGLISAREGATVVFLIVSSTDRSYWHDIIYKEAQEIRFLRGRIKFGGKKTTAPFASAIVVFRPDFMSLKITFVDYRKEHQ